MLDVAGRTQEAGNRLKAAYAGDQDHPAPDRRLCAQSLAPGQERRSQGRLSRLRQDPAAQSRSCRPRSPILRRARSSSPWSATSIPAAARRFFTASAPMASAPPRAGRATKSPRSSSCGCRWFSRRINVLALDTLGEAYSQIRQYEAAVDIYDQMPDSSPLRVTADIHIALLLDAMGKIRRRGQAAARDRRRASAERRARVGAGRRAALAQACSPNRPTPIPACST